MIWTQYAAISHSGQPAQISHFEGELRPNGILLWHECLCFEPLGGGPDPTEPSALLISA